MKLTNLNTEILFKVLDRPEYDRVILETLVRASIYKEYKSSSKSLASALVDILIYDREMFMRVVNNNFSIHTVAYLASMVRENDTVAIQCILDSTQMLENVETNQQCT